MSASTGHGSETREFPRETKFLVHRDDAERIRQWARRSLDPDPHGGGLAGDQYSTTTLYFETAGFDVYFRRGSFGRGKFRVRRYGASDLVFLERKLRTEGLLAKRRTIVPLTELAPLTQPLSRDWAGHWFHKRLLKRVLEPSCQLSYRRMARVLTVDGLLSRLTLDEDLRVQPASTITVGHPGGELVLRDHVILELKYQGAMPAAFLQLMQEMSLQPQTLSKYRLGIAALGRIADASAGDVGSTARATFLHEGETR